MDKNAKYRRHCLREESLPIFSRDWWLDAVCGEDRWQVALVEKGGHIIGSMPYYVKKSFGFTVLCHPPLTQTLGPWIRPSKAKYGKKLSYEKSVMGSLIEQLPKCHAFMQNWHYENTNWLPFFWKGFDQTTRYTYVLPLVSDEGVIWGQLAENIRREIRKATNRFELRARDDLGVEEFLNLNRMTFAHKGRRLPYNETVVKRLDMACQKRMCRKIWIAEDKHGKYHAGVYIIWSKNSAYYLMGGGDPELRKSGATSFVMWEAIKHAAGVTRKFDFEGSMLEPVERFFRAFGAIQTPYFCVSKTNSRLLKIRKAFA